MCERDVTVSHISLGISDRGLSGAFALGVLSSSRLANSGERGVCVSERYVCEREREREREIEAEQRM